MDTISIKSATKSDMDIILNLIDFYIYDMSKSMEWECNKKGRFGGCDDSREYWQLNHPETQLTSRWPDGRQGHPYILKTRTGIAGFALVRQMESNSDVDFDMGEFFICGKYQRQGHGRFVANKLFDMFRGRWSVRQLVANALAQKFWHSIVDDYSQGHFTETFSSDDGWDMVCLQFDNKLV